MALGTIFSVRTWKKSRAADRIALAEAKHQISTFPVWGADLMKMIAVLTGSFLVIAALQAHDCAMAAVGVSESGPPVSGCAPKPGEGAHWLTSCENAANAGDARAAYIVGSIYWNGDGVPKDNASAAHWWKLADQNGQPEAAKLLGDEAYVRVVLSKGKGKVDLSALDEGIGWYQKALKVELSPALRQEAQVRLDQFLKLKRLFPDGCASGVGGPNGCEPQ
jgi:hypothetical protein